MNQYLVSGITIECLTGNIADQPDMEAIVNAANAQLAPGGGVAGAIHRAAGPGLERECRPMAPIEPGQAVLSAAHNLSNSYVIHCLGPVYGLDEPSDQLLAQCYSEALVLAEREGVTSLAFPAISTGAFGYPLEAATQVALTAVWRCLSELTKLRQIRFVLFSERDLAVYEAELAGLA